MHPDFCFSFKNCLQLETTSQRRMFLTHTFRASFLLGVMGQEREKNSRNILIHSFKKEVILHYPEVVQSIPPTKNCSTTSLCCKFSLRGPSTYALI